MRLGISLTMSQEARERLRKQKGTAIFVYDASDMTLYIFESKTHMYNLINIHNKPLMIA